ncbi:hypothetical protein D3C75_970990 [compost metagenome]
MPRRQHVFCPGGGSNHIGLAHRTGKTDHCPAVIACLQRPRRIDFRHDHLPAVGFRRRRDALPNQTITDHQHAFFMQRQMGGLEESVPGGQADHMAVMQPFFYRQVIPVEDRIARRHAV